MSGSESSSSKAPRPTSKNKARQAGEQASPRDVIEWQSLVATCLSTNSSGDKPSHARSMSDWSGCVDGGRGVQDDIEDFEVQSAASSMFHLSDSSTHAGANWCKYIVADQEFRWGFLKSLVNALRAPYGVLYRDAPLSTVIGVIRTLERYWGDLMDDMEIDMVHNVYETIRDCYKQKSHGHSGLSNDDALALKCASLHSLTVLLVEANLITRDHRLVKFHVDHLVRLLFVSVAEDDLIVGASNLWLLKATGSTCLCLMEKDVPTLLSRQGAMYAREAMATESVTAVKGFPKTSLAVTVFAHACEKYNDRDRSGLNTADIVNQDGDFQFSVVSEEDNLSTSQRYHYPRHLETDAFPVSIMTEYARATIAELFLFALDVMKRMNAETIKRLSAPLRVLATHARIEPVRKLWPVMCGLIDTGNVHIMEFILDTHDAHPELFEGRRPCLLEKIIARANDGAYSVEQRQLCLRWVARQHANACERNKEIGECVDDGLERADSSSVHFEKSRKNGPNVSEEIQRYGERAFLLDDCWMLLIPMDHDQPSIVHLRVKVLAGCMASRVGDPATIAQGILLWSGFADPNNMDKFLYAIRQLYRTMDTAEYCDEEELRAEAAFIRAIIHASVVYPHALKPIQEFLDICDDTMRVRILAGYSGLFSQLDEQFEVLRAMDNVAGPSNQASHGHLQKASSTLAGMMRGLSLRLSRRSINASAIEDSGANSPGDTPTVSRAGSFKIPSAPSSRRRLLSDGGDSKRSMESESPERERANISTSTPFARTPKGVSEISAFTTLHRNAYSGADLTLPDMQHVDELEEWILADKTWSFLKRAMLRDNDLMLYRSVIHRIVRRADIVPCNVLKTITNYAWQYRGHAPHLALGTKETGAAIIAIVQTAALAHLPLADEDAEPSHQQNDVIEALHEVLDAMQDGFPCPTALKQAMRISKLVSDENSWRPSRSLATMASMLGGYIESAVDVPI